MSEERLQGVIERIVYEKPDTNFRILWVQTTEHRLVKVVGEIGECSEGMRIDAFGFMKMDPKFGPQFRTKTALLSSPEQSTEIAQYLASARIPGIGPKTARQIVKFFGKEIKDVLDNEPQRLREVPGIGKSKADAIIAAWQGDRSRAETIAKMMGLGLTHHQSTRILEKYGEKAAHVATNEPYRLAQDVWGIGFKTADAVALAGGMATDSPKRIQAAIQHVLLTAAGEGHCYMPIEPVTAHTAGMLDLDEGLIGPQLTILAEQGRIKTDARDRVFPMALYRAEQEVAQRVAVMAATEFPMYRQVKAAFLRASRAFHPTQINAGVQVFSAGITILTGGPGTGKTTLTKSFSDAGKAAGLKVRLCSPTGRAAKHLSQATGEPASTIHRLLEFDPGQFKFTRNEDRPIDANWVIVDEASMVDIRLMHSLVSALAPGTALTLIGDRHQLPPVGPGAPFHDMVNNPLIPYAELTVVFRQDEGSHIIAAASAILEGHVPGPAAKTEDLTDFYFIPVEDKDRAFEMVVELVGQRIKKRFGFDPRTEIQVLIPTYKGLLGADRLNSALRGAVLGVQTDKRFVKGDRVLQIRNNYDKNVFNGDIGTIIAIDGQQTTINFDGNHVVYAPQEMDELTLAYAITIHKAQGSEFPCVVVVLSTQHMIMLRRSLVYTAITRGKQLVVLVAHPYALKMAVQNAEGINRNTTLREILGTH